MAGWQSGYAAACKAVYAGSIPASASITGGFVHYEDNNYRNRLCRPSYRSMFAEIGHNVTCYDIDRSKIQSLKNGIVPFFEPSLKELVKKNITSENLFFSSSIKTALKNRFIFICVDTPDDGRGKPNLANLNKVIDLTCI